MTQITEQQVKQLFEDITYVRQAIQKNTSIIQQMDFHSSLRLLSVTSGSAILLFSGLFYLLINHFGSYCAIPQMVRYGIYTAIAIITLLLGLMKQTLVLRSARKVQPNISLFKLAKEYYSLRVYHMYVPLFLCAAFLTGYCIYGNNSHYIIPIVSLALGFYYIQFGTLLRFNEALIAGYWMIISGSVVTLYNSLSPMFSLPLTLGIGLILFGLGLYIHPEPSAEK